MKGRLRLLVLLLLAVAVRNMAQVPQKIGPGFGRSLSNARPATYKPNELLVRFRPGVDSRSIQQVHKQVNGEVAHAYQIVPNLHLVRVPEGTDVLQAITTYRSNPSVLYAEPNYQVHTQVTPNDPFFVDGTQWDLHNTGQNGGIAGADIDAVDAWNITTGDSSVVVGVTDTGIDFNHPDLAPNMHMLESNCSDGIDNDGNGHIDDCFGINAITGSSNPFDDNEHGTHVSGTIGARGNNGIGVAGINWNVGLVACKFLDATGSGVVSDAITCLEYFKDLKDNHGLNLVATNNSWGGGGFSQALFDAIEAHMQSGILFIAAAGNRALDNDFGGFYPADYYLPNVISVAATQRFDGLSVFSNFGGRTVHIAAPGQDIISTTPNGTYTVLSGTSMAAPHVTGLAALLKAQDQTRDWRAIKNLILSGGDNSIAGPTITGVRLNANGSLTCASPKSVLARLRPVGDIPVATFGQPVLIAVHFARCAAPGGTIDATINPGGTVLSLKDDGVAPDQVAADGIYSAFFNPSSPGLYTVTLTWSGCPGCTQVFTVSVIRPYFFQPVASSYQTITGTGMNFNGFGGVFPVTPSFPIPFGDGSFSQLFISNAGTISFDAPISTTNNFDIIIFNQMFPVNQAATLVAPFWTMLSSPDNTHNVFYQEIGTAPDREFVVEWRDVNVCDNLNDINFGTCFSNSDARFQVVFFESKSDILFNYASVVFGGQAGFADLGSNATIGIQTGVSLADQFGFNAPVLDNNTSLLWTTSGPDTRPSLPSILSLSPPATAVGTAPTLTINGTNFTTNSIVRWNGVDRSTTFVNGGQLTIQTAAADVANVGSAKVQVFTFAGGISNAATFNVLNSPQISSLGSASASAGGPAFALTVLGSNFDAGSVVNWNGVPRSTAFVTNTQLVVSINAADITSPGTATISVLTGAGLSSANMNFTITDFNLTDTGPSSVNGGQTATFTVNLEPTPAGFSFGNAVALSCTLPSSAGTCSFASSQLTPGAAGAQTTLNITTNTRAALVPTGNTPGLNRAPVFVLTALAVFALATRKTRGLQTRRVYLLIAATVLGCSLLVSCGGGNAVNPPPPTPPSPLTVTVSINATSGSVVHNTSFNLTIR
jgi:subtilisin family serine protease